MENTQHMSSGRQGTAWSAGRPCPIGLSAPRSHPDKEN